MRRAKCRSSRGREKGKKDWVKKKHSAEAG
jgi:hypothetical protein